MLAARDLALSELRERIGRLESRGRPRKALPFGVRAVDRHLPGGGLALDSLHEVMETGAASEHAAVATLFIAGILARNKGPVLWCVRRRDLFAPALAAVGLHPDRVIYAETHRESEVLAAAEEGLRHKGLAGVVAEVALTLARATNTGVLALYVASDGERQRRRRFTNTSRTVEAALKEIVAHADQMRVPIRTAVRVKLAPSDAILRQARLGGHNLVVMGVTRRPGDTLFFGNVALSVLEAADRSVLFIAS
jgi:hypothetical protein